MKKLFIILALAGMTASASASIVSIATKTSIVSLRDDGKKKKDKKDKCCADTAKSCCKGDDKGKCTDKKGGCCSKDKQAEAPATPK